MCFVFSTHSLARALSTRTLFSACATHPGAATTMVLCGGYSDVKPADADVQALLSSPEVRHLAALRDDRAVTARPGGRASARRHPFMITYAARAPLATRGGPLHTRPASATHHHLPHNHAGARRDRRRARQARRRARRAGVPHAGGRGAQLPRAGGARRRRRGGHRHGLQAAAAHGRAARGQGRRRGRGAVGDGCGACVGGFASGEERALGSRAREAL